MFVYKVNFCVTLVIKTVLYEKKHLDFYDFASLELYISNTKFMDSI
jgi:hypothetical protein